MAQIIDITVQINVLVKFWFGDPPFQFGALWYKLTHSEFGQLKNCKKVQLSHTFQFKFTGIDIKLLNIIGLGGVTTSR